MNKIVIDADRAQLDEYITELVEELDTFLDSQYDDLVNEMDKSRE